MTTTLRPEDINLRDASGNWIIGTIGPFQVQAKAFAEPSNYGMPEDQRISILCVTLLGTPRTVLYNYDRGDLMTDHLKAEGLAEIVDAIAKRIR
jgi:hypothetical protein